MDPKWAHLSASNFEFRPYNLQFSDNSPNTSEDTRDIEEIRPPPTSSIAQSSAVSTSTSEGPIRLGASRGIGVLEWVPSHMP